LLSAAESKGSELRIRSASAEKSGEAMMILVLDSFHEVMKNPASKDAGFFCAQLAEKKSSFEREKWSGYQRKVSNHCVLIAGHSG